MQPISGQQNKIAIWINKYYPFAILYVFFNSVFLPHGLLYTTLLTPFFMLWLMQYRSASLFLYYPLLLMPFAVVHYINGVNPFYYLKSTALFFSVYVFCMTAYEYLKRRSDLDRLYNTILFTNTVLCLLAVVCFFIPQARGIFWMDYLLSEGIEHVNRLKMFTYEPSYYALLLTPLALYYYLKAVLKKLDRPFLILFLITIPFLLSLSFGVFACLGISFSISAVMYLFSLYSNRQIYTRLLLCGIALLVLIGLVYLIKPDNIIFGRIANVFKGNDTSFKGRTSDSFYLAWQVADLKSHWWGCGLGQVKLLGVKIWSAFYPYSPEFTLQTVTIPNAVAETLANFGIIGVFFRLGAAIFLFFRTKVFSNYYRLALFIFVFIYQFTGSFIYNIAEYVIWVLAFSPIFEEFNKKSSSDKAGA